MPRSSAAPFPAALLLPAVLLLAGCGEEPDNSNWDATQAATEDGDTRAVDTVDGADGGDWNQFFPPQEGDWDRVYRQEKRGTATADYEKDEEVMFTITVSDTAENVSARGKFADAVMEIDGFPAVKQGSKTTAVLVNDRYQVKAIGKSDAFTEADREAWLKKFDLAGLAAFDALK